MSAMLLSEIGVISFITSFIFVLGGLGSAVALIPILVFLGVPFPVARSTGLFVNVLSTSSASYYNIKKKLINFKFGIPLVVFAFLFAPIGAYLSKIIPEVYVGLFFGIFLLFAGAMAIIPKKREKYREHMGITIPMAVGATGGLISGLLGVGGGGFMSPVLFLLGYNPIDVAFTVAFTVPFSSLAGFLVYWKLGYVNWLVLLWTAIPAILGGYAGNAFVHKKLNDKQVKIILGMIFLLLGVKVLFKYIGKI